MPTISELAFRTVRKSLAKNPHYPIKKIQERVFNQLGVIFDGRTIASIRSEYIGPRSKRKK